MRKGWETLISKRSQGPLPGAPDLPSVCAAERVSFRGYCPTLRPLFLVSIRSTRTPSGHPCPGEPLTRLSLASLLLRGLHHHELRGVGGGKGPQTAAKKPSGASAANHPEPKGALQGLRAREVTFPGLSDGSCSVHSSGCRKTSQVPGRDASSSPSCLPAA